MPRTIVPARPQTPIPTFKIGGNVSAGQYGEQPGSAESARQARIRARRAYFKNPTKAPAPPGNQPPGAQAPPGQGAVPPGQGAIPPPPTQERFRKTTGPTKIIPDYTTNK